MIAPRGGSDEGGRRGICRHSAVAALSAMLVAGGLLGCRGKEPGGIPREQVTALLQKEAEAIKATGANLDPVLRVKASWTLAELTVKERPGDADRPWSGLIRFHIRAETSDIDGRVQVDELDKRFDYLWSASLHRWLIQPPAS